MKWFIWTACVLLVSGSGCMTKLDQAMFDMQQQAGQVDDQGLNAVGVFVKAADEVAEKKLKLEDQYTKQQSDFFWKSHTDVDGNLFAVTKEGKKVPMPAAIVVQMMEEQKEAAVALELGKTKWSLTKEQMVILVTRLRAMHELMSHERVNHIEAKKSMQEVVTGVAGLMGSVLGTTLGVGIPLLVH